MWPRVLPIFSSISSSQMPSSSWRITYRSYYMNVFSQPNGNLKYLKHTWKPFWNCYLPYIFFTFSDIYPNNLNMMFKNASDNSSIFFPSCCQKSSCYVLTNKTILFPPGKQTNKQTNKKQSPINKLRYLIIIHRRKCHITNSHMYNSLKNISWWS